MWWTINHSQVKVTDRRLAFHAANRMNFDNINSIPLFSCTHSFYFFFYYVVRSMLVSLWLSNYRQNLLAHLSRQKKERRAEEEEKGNSLITLACCTVRSLIKPSYLPVTPSQKPPTTVSFPYLPQNIWKLFSQKIIQDFCLGWILRKGDKIFWPCQRYSWHNGKVFISERACV